MTLVRGSLVGVMLVILLLVPACRQPPEPEATGRSSFAFVNPPVGPPPQSKGEVIEPVDRAQYREAQLLEPAVQPAYPARALKGKARPVTVGVRITVGTDGRVADIRPSVLVFSSPGSFAEDFRDAVEAAVRQWRFTPARAEYFEIVNEGGFTFNRVTRTELVETEFDLSFTFTATGGVQFSPTGRYAESFSFSFSFRSQAA